MASQLLAQLQEASGAQKGAQLLTEGPLGQPLIGLCQPYTTPARDGQEEGAWRKLNQSAAERKQQLTALKAEVAELGSRALLCGAYTDRLEQLRLVFEEYKLSVGQLVSRFGLVGQKAAGNESVLVESLRSSEAALQRAVQSGSTDLARLLQASWPQERGMLSAPAVLPVVRAGMQEDAAALAALAQSPGAQSLRHVQQEAPLEGLLDTLRQQHWQEYLEGEAALQQQQELDKQLEDVGIGATGAEEGAITPAALLAAKVAGLRAALRLVDRIGQELAGRQRSAGAQQQEARKAVSTLQQLQQQEEELDRGIRELCAADAAFMGQWQEGVWRAQRFVSDGILAASQPLQQLSAQVVGAMGQELAAFQAMAWPAGPAEPRSSAEAAALRLDPVADLKTADHCAAVISSAADELQELRPVSRAWEALAASNQLKVRELEATTAALQEKASLVDGSGAQGIQEHLAEACGAAEAGMAAVKGVRAAMTDWWTLPALKAAPWIKYEGKSATEWLHVLSEQQELLSTREVFKDHSI